MLTYRTLDALGDARRRAILEHLRSGPASVGQIADRLPVSRPAVSQHLRVLEDARLVRHDAVGTRRVYRLDPTGAEDVRRWLDDLWTTALGAYARHVAATEPTVPTENPATESAAQGPEPATDAPRRTP
ncbi:metalloregulator ArsR/SmtB family transcription factor [Cellulosimicrobium sp. Marseille-Q4280]|uniref:ArsR/SmtB family transcription factor n=1 Tax=Cellulosimicrobium sp. Marseille-Q4280 TaxID=2937992 RepID=UPI00203A71D5|nr:metalloregulator ArsR/SmtB family transcription factor [Cellulosimicrobium sp. Marseille-Q4280]